MGDGLAGATLGDAFEEFADLVEEHDEDAFRELRLHAGEETDAEGAEGGNRHQEVLVERFSVAQPFRGLFQRIPTDDEVRDQENEQLRPQGHGDMLREDAGADQQDRRRSNADDGLARAAFFVMMFVMMLMALAFVFMLMAMAGMMMFFHNRIIYRQQRYGESAAPSIPNNG